MRIKATDIINPLPPKSQFVISKNKSNQLSMKIYYLVENIQFL